jgi:pantetheine-phosphate adenylyltransferase
MQGKTIRIGIYPGTFDPITKGHLHIIKRASKQVDRLIIGVAVNARKNPRFSLDQRMEMVKFDCANMPEKYCDIDVVSFDNLLVHFAKEMQATAIFRGLRAVSDFDYETVFLMAADKWQFVSASFVKEIHALGGDVSEFVTPGTLDRLNKTK